VVEDLGSDVDAGGLRVVPQAALVAPAEGAVQMALFGLRKESQAVRTIPPANIYPADLPQWALLILGTLTSTEIITDHTVQIIYLGLVYVQCYGLLIRVSSMHL